jgi:hypothetical protein
MKGLFTRSGREGQRRVTIIVERSGPLGPSGKREKKIEPLTAHSAYQAACFCQMPQTAFAPTSLAPSTLSSEKHSTGHSIPFLVLSILQLDDVARR